MTGRYLRSGALALLLAACAGVPRAVPNPVAPAPPEEIETTVFLIGDGGSPTPQREPVLQSLARDLAAARPAPVVVFLGDNIYPRGLPAPGAPDRHAAERQLLAQLQAVLRGPGVGIVIPGNHDWDEAGQDGWDAIRRQGRFVDSVGAGRITMLPANGCPGPAVRDFGARLRIVTLDTQWWLHNGPRPYEGGGEAAGDQLCPADREDEVIDSLLVALHAGDGRRVVIVGHHPLRSGGPHGGRFGWKAHVFPLSEWRSWLWLPLPVLGSIYPLARRSGVTQQDVSGSRYEQLREALRRAFAERPPLLYASGHDHSLQVLEDEDPEYLVVSGAGVYGHTSHVAWLPETRFAAPGASGYVRLDVLRQGRVRLGVITVDRESRGTERFSMYLD
jgi:hypothetical protein